MNNALPINSRVYLSYLCLGVVFLTIACDDDPLMMTEINNSDADLGTRASLDRGSNPETGGMSSDAMLTEEGDAGITDELDEGPGQDFDGMRFCTPGVSSECISDTEQSVCDESGFQYNTVPCPEGQFCFEGNCGTQRCEPDTTRCLSDDPNRVFICDPTGEMWVEGPVCEQGLACQNGGCMSRCELAAKLNTYIGCEYWTVDLDNYPDPFTSPMPNEVPHSIVIANPGDQSAMIRFETRSAAMINPPQAEVAAGEVRAFSMPRLDIDGSGITNHSIKVSSSMPVIAYQFNPLNNSDVFSNDASLLLPVNTLGRNYIVASWPTGVDTVNIIPTGIVPQAGYFTVVAVAPGETTVTVRVTAPTTTGVDVMPLNIGDTATFQLQQFEVLNLEAAPFTPDNFGDLFNEVIHDLTGSTVEASQPVAVFGGHEEAVVAFNRTDRGAGADSPCCADHLEEQLIPLSVWSNEALCVKAKPRSDSGEKDIWRVISAADGNTFTTIPPIEGIDGVTLNRGEWVHVEAAESFKVEGTGPLQAVQYLISQEQTDERIGDPSMILAVPTQQYREEYNILVPMGYDADWVTVIRPAGLIISMDGSPLNERFEPFAGGDWERAYVPVSPGSHEFLAAEPFGLVAYGWNRAVSYGYPAGLNLRTSDAEP